MKNNLWASRHTCPDIETVGCDAESKEIIWPSDYYGCVQTWIDLSTNYANIYGVFPAQAIEALGDNLIHEQLKGRIFSAVSIPVKAEGGSQRNFEFIRWAKIL